MYKIFGTDILRKNSIYITDLHKFLDVIFIQILFYIHIIPNITNRVLILYFVIVFFSLYFLMSVSGLYKSFRVKMIRSLGLKIFSTWLNIVAFMSLLSFLGKINLNLNSDLLTLWFFEIFLYLIFSHLILRLILRSIRKKGNNTRSLLFVGDAFEYKNFVNELNNNEWYGYRIHAWFYKSLKEIEKTDLELPPVHGIFEDLEHWLSNNKVDKIIFSSNGLSRKKIQKFKSIFGNTSISVSCIPSWAELNMRLNIDYLGNMVMIEMWGSEDDFLIILYKRIFDIILSSLIIILTAPALILISIVIKITSKGPIIFLQNRYGLDSKKFKIYKFRTMYTLESGELKDLKHAQINDERVTPIGKILRKWSLDELPQLFNVLLGTMSLVGPRPHAVSHNEKYRKLITGYMQRHSFKPGMTGLAQINDLRGGIENIIDMEKRIEADLLYQSKWDIFLDLSILINTILKFKSKKAY